MKITKGALMVMKGQKVSTLYRLIGNTVVERVAITIPVECSTDDTKLCICDLAILVNVVC